MTEPRPKALTRAERRTVQLSVTGAVLELYDFVVYVFLTPYLAAAFFPDDSARTSNTLGVFAVGYFGRPLGGVLFGHLGDTRGRRNTFSWTVLLMAVPTFAIGLLPTAATLGLAAPILLVLLRFLQGVALGGELPGAMTFLFEHTPPSRRGLTLGLLAGALGLGSLLGAGVTALLTSVLDTSQLRQFGWRIPFFIGGVLGLVAFQIRRRLTESPAFERLRDEHLVAKLPLAELLRHGLGSLAKTFCVVSFVGVFAAVFHLYLPTFLHERRRWTMRDGLALTTAGLIVLTPLLPLTGALSDRIGRRRVLGAASVAIAILAVPAFAVFAHGEVASVVVTALGVIAVFSLIGPYLAFVAEAFPPRTRYSGVGLSYNAAFALVVGTAPAVSEILATRVSVGPGAYVALWAVVAGVAIWFARERANVTAQDERGLT